MEKFLELEKSVYFVESFRFFRGWKFLVRKQVILQKILQNFAKNVSMFGGSFLNELI
jgi:hypothetical protein